MCSACAGDYEDPDWSAWDEDVEEIEEVSREVDEAKKGQEETEGDGAERLG
jgi:hypothetical protein